MAAGDIRLQKGARRYWSSYGVQLPSRTLKPNKLAALLLLLLIFLPNPIWEHLYPKSVTSKKESSLPSFAVAYKFEDYGESEEASPKSNTETHLFQKTKTMFSILPTTNTDPPIKIIATKTFTGERKTNLPTTDKNILASQELPLPTQPARTTSRWKVKSMTLNKHVIVMPLQAKSFTAEPEWKIEEDYILDTSASKTKCGHRGTYQSGGGEVGVHCCRNVEQSCPISVKIKALNSSWLKEKFLNQITIFLDNHHFSNHEWVRLGHFIPPYGWMELNYTVVREVVSALPRIPDQQLLLTEKSEDKFPRCISCAVVGNGGILNASGLGREIDEHDYVFRVNGAVITGHEKDVGVRTSFYGFTAFTMLSSLYLLREKGFPNIPRDKETKYILFTEARRDYEWLKALQQNKDIKRGTLEQYRLHPRNDFGNNFDFNRLLVAHPDFVRYLKNRFLRSSTLSGKHWSIYRPSTGALVLLTALHLCDTVSAYGFMTHDYRNYSDHYYDKDKTKIILYSNHDFLLEKDLWAQLHHENIMKLYQRT
ncbi:PREDICTED: alpha-N-acetylgalactosaminide alpha-2,6-sialyltransferase 1 [Nanorana parkeri]|uniref:alpha-N-acetylgalactosaminide alpha-2,6-sialyltransferase 1 n=1 Tax=Nanorana parkeri TaxID=125878 RepID=UPI00085428D0|nr:PREDICTED: alpha-N-acetylgalactosaminide alpha-2,6-sialyltransferase 1 [Nanorana parkeri]